MPKTIWKFDLTDLTPARFSVEMPRGAVVLTAREQGPRSICLWALVDPDAPKEKRGFEIFGTGWELPAGERRYVGTALLSGGSLVFHVFERL